MDHLITAILATATITSTSLWSSSAQAVPHVYTGLVIGINSLQECLKQAEKIARQNGFTDNNEIVGSGTMQDFHADQSDKPLSITVSCSTKLGGAAIAVAGMNNEDTFSMFQKFYDEF